MMTIEEEIKEFDKIIKHMSDIYRAKHHDYGQSTKDTFRRYGPVSMAVRMRDKLNRFDRLIEFAKRDENSFVDESIYDTLIDLANYAIITMIEYRDAMIDGKQNENKIL